MAMPTPTRASESAPAAVCLPFRDLGSFVKLRALIEHDLHCRSWPVCALRRCHLPPLRRWHLQPTGLPSIRTGFGFHRFLISIVYSTLAETGVAMQQLRPRPLHPGFLSDRVRPVPGRSLLQQQVRSCDSVMRFDLVACAFSDSRRFALMCSAGVPTTDCQQCPKGTFQNKQGQMVRSPSTLHDFGFA